MSIVIDLFSNYDLWLCANFGILLYRCAGLLILNIWITKRHTESQCPSSTLLMRQIS